MIKSFIKWMTTSKDQYDRVEMVLAIVLAVIVAGFFGAGWGIGIGLTFAVGSLVADNRYDYSNRLYQRLRVYARS